MAWRIHTAVCHCPSIYCGSLQFMHAKPYEIESSDRSITNIWSLDLLMFNDVLAGKNRGIWEEKGEEVGSV